MEFKIEILIYYNDVVASASGGSVATDTGARVLSLRHPVTAAARTLGVKESAGMSGESSVRGAYRGSVRVQSAPGEPAGWCPGVGDPLVPVAGRNSALENLRSITSATYLPLAISALVAAVGTMGMVHPVLLTQMLVVACGAACVLGNLKEPARYHVLQAGNSNRISTTSASEYNEFPLFPWGEWGSLHGAAPAIPAPASAGASPARASARGKTGEKPGGGSRTTAQGHICAIPSPGSRSQSLMYPPYTSELN